MAGYGNSTPAATTCLVFATALANTGTSTACPTPSIASSGTMNFAIQVNDTTKLLLSDRTAAVLGNIAVGNIVNIYGYYDGSDTIQASIVRDTSKPIGVGVPATTGQTSTTSGTIQIGTLQTLLAQLESFITELENIINGTASSTATSTVTSSTMLPVIGNTTTTPAPQNY
jgi:hypothetical protein